MFIWYVIVKVRICYDFSRLFDGYEFNGSYNTYTSRHVHSRSCISCVPVYLSTFYTIANPSSMGNPRPLRMNNSTGCSRI
jgi:hypothetical protein